MGRANAYQDNMYVEFIRIENDLILCAGKKLLSNRSCSIKAGTILGVNGISIVQPERIRKGIYIGIPARKLQ